jgi:micrococcal nuclease
MDEGRRAGGGTRPRTIWAAVGAALLLFSLSACAAGETGPSGLRGSRTEPGSSPELAEERHDPSGPKKRGRDSQKEKERKPALAPKSPAPVASPPSTRRVASVIDVIDGDTIEVSRSSGSESVRLIGVDTPETVHPSVPVECFGPKASSFTTTALLAKTVRLEFDDERRDHYGRLLAYVWTRGKLFNKVLVERGYAEVTIYAPNDEHEAILYSAQSRARAADRGAWGACAAGAPGGGGGGNGGGGAAPAPASGGPGCDPNYTGACIPRYPPDIDCDDAGATNFSSVGSDPHGFDGDSDGVACEG